MKKTDLLQELVLKKDEIQQLKEHVYQLESNIQSLTYALDQERKLFPHHGIWLVKEGSSQLMCLENELPDPVELATFYHHVDKIASAVGKCWQLYREKGSQSGQEVADAIVKEIVNRKNEQDSF